MMFAPDIEPGFRKAAVVVALGHGLLFALIWLMPAADVSAPRPITVRLQSDANEAPAAQKTAHSNPRIAKPASSVKQLPAPLATQSPTPSPTPAPAVPPTVAPAVTPAPPISASTASAAKSALSESATALSSKPAESGGSSSAPAVLGKTDDRQPMVDASFRGNRIPEYPVMSRRLGEQGVVVLRVLITPDGQASEVLLIKSSGSSRLDRSAMDTIREWRFVPALRGGRPVAAWYEWRWEFRLSG